MKKVLLSLALGLVVVFSMSTAQAAILDGWRLDLSGVGGGNNTNIDHLVVTGNATVTQYFAVPIRDYDFSPYRARRDNHQYW